MITKIEAIIYRINKAKPEFLICKRPESHGGFWQFITGKVKNKESLEETLKREILEETGIGEFVEIKDPDYSFNFKNWKGLEVEEHVFYVEVPPGAHIILNEEFVEYRFLPYDETTKLLEWENQKIILHNFHEK